MVHAGLASLGMAPGARAMQLRWLTSDRTCRFLVVTVARKPKTTQMRHGQRLVRAPSKEGAGLHFVVGGISNANNSRMLALTCVFYASS